MIACCTLLLLSLLSSSVLSDVGVGPTFNEVDRVSGAQLTCAQCPPGQFMRQRCTAQSVSVCEDCPPGSFTASWNYISRCLRCSVCGRNMVQMRSCSRNADCSCACKHGYYFKETAGMCARWSECGTGQGVNQLGTAYKNVECMPCANGTFSDKVSSESICLSHAVCQAPRSHVILRGVAWHDVICASCEDARNHDATHFLRELLPSFFSHHALSLRRLRHVVSKLPSADGSMKHRRSVSGLTQDQLQSRLNRWTSDARPDQLRSLPQILTETGAAYTSERLSQKLKRIESTLRQVCPQSTTEPPQIQD